MSGRRDRSVAETRGADGPGAGHGSIARSVLLFGVAFGLFQVLFVGGLAEGPAFRGYLALNADLAARLLRLLGFAVQARGTLVLGDGGGLGIERGCDAVQPIVLLVLAVLFFPATRRWKAVGVLGGAALLLALNLVRIVSLYVLHLKASEAFVTWHTMLWPMLFVLTTLLVWCAWALRGTRPTGVT